MNPELSHFAARLRGLMANPQSAIRNPQFSELALELFTLQFQHNPAYRKICEARRLSPSVVKHWPEIPAVPAAAFKELELTSLAPDERTAVFHSSGTTGQKSSRHFHCAESMATYEASLWSWFEFHFGNLHELVFLTPGSIAAPHSSLVHMFETVRRKSGFPGSSFLGRITGDGWWALDLAAAIQKLQSACDSAKPLLLLGTAFLFVHLLDQLSENNLRFQLPEGSRVMETGGYKNRSRTLPRAGLHALITERLGVPRENIICEYGMSELSSQAYDSEIKNSKIKTQNPERHFRLPPWARVQIVSPETGCEVAEGGIGLIRIFDLANVFSVAAIQAEDLGIRRGDGFELIGRVQQAEPRGCSLLSV